MMKCYNMNELPEKTTELYEDMTKHEIYLGNVIHLLVINACSMCLSRQKGYLIHAEIMNKNKDIKDIRINNALINMYGKFGDIDNARQVFDSMSERNTVTYNRMMNSYGLNSQGHDALELYRKMREQEFRTRDSKTFTVRLNACSHSSLVDEARKIFFSIDKRYWNKFVTAAMVDTLARSQHWDEAQSIIENYEKTNKHNIVMWSTLLGVSRTYKKDKKPKEIYDKINEIENITNDQLAPANILLANTYSSAGEYDKAESIRQKINNENIRKIPGMTCIEINGVNHSFYAHDKSHSKSNEIYDELHKLQQELIDYGHRFDYNLITRRVKTEHGETPLSVIMGHSEKLATAYGLISTKQNESLFIANNLRICSDCHEAIKLISRIHQREIVVRDAQRFHKFENGQ
ncbi:unnamed protein product [Didymodactylos carnosus]|uniref:DYW domain-containing protein n=1 Tax=Didymodactylos carnosus TaxID=1234261 RepID=A0A8S2SKP7_9BILA|nr:unnamed protein product [Didymodactylos carnosus]CAF4227322.1 unnamed protein product [Didymodactylos carnosus]